MSDTSPQVSDDDAIATIEEAIAEYRAGRMVIVMDDEDRDNLREAGFSERAIWDIAAVAAFFNMTNRLAAAIELTPNDEYHSQARSAP